MHEGWAWGRGGAERRCKWSRTAGLVNNRGCVNRLAAPSLPSYPAASETQSFLKNTRLIGKSTSSPASSHPRPRGLYATAPRMHGYTGTGAPHLLPTQRTQHIRQQVVHRVCCAGTSRCRCSRARAAGPAPGQLREEQARARLDACGLRGGWCVRVS